MRDSNLRHWGAASFRNLASLAIFATMAVLPAASHAQVDTGSLTGTVSDGTGAIISGGDVLLTNTASGVATKATTTSSGTYTFDSLKAGSYTLRVALPGFKVYVSPGVEIHVQQRDTVDVALEPGAATDQVTVTAAAPLLQAQDASVGQTIDSQTVNDTPLNGRDWVSIGQIAAGVTTSAGGSVNDPSYTVNGINSGQNDFRLDGIDDNVEQYGGTSGTGNASIIPPPDAIQEFKLQTGDFSAEFGHSTGGVVNAVIKSGGNQVHGDLFEYFRNDILDANDYFSNRNGVSRQEYRQNQFGGTVGGPVYLPKFYDGRNKTFFFVDYQGTRIIQPISSTSTVPTANIVNSGYTNLQDLITDNSGTRQDGLGRVFSNGTVFDPSTTRTVASGALDVRTGLQNTSSNAIAVRDPFYNGSIAGVRDFTTLTANLNQLPANRLDPNAIRLLQLYPAANRAGFVNNYFQDAKSNQTINTYDIRIDQNFSGHDTLFGVYSRSHRVLLQPGNLPGLADGQVFGNGTQDSPHYAIAIGYDHVFSSTLSNEFRFGFNQNTDNVIPSEGNTPGIPEQFGITGVPNIADNGGLPPIDIGGLANFGVATYIPTIRTIRSIEVSDNLTKNVGTHSFKVGYQIVRIAGDITQPPFAKGFYTFSGQFTTVPNTLSQSTQINQTPASGITGISDLLLTPTASTVGGPNNVGGLSQFSGSNFASTDDLRYYMGAYFQDDWKATPSLTLNLGLRWDHTTPYAETSGRQANFQANGGNGPGGIFYIPSKTIGNPRSASFNTLTARDGIAIQSTSLSTGTAQFTNFAPRLGFAYRINARTVVRGGYGIAYGALANIGFGGTLGTNYPFLYSVGLTSPNSSSPIVLPDGTTAALENSLAVENLSDPTSVNAQGISLAGRQFNFQTPYSQTSNLTVQYQIDNHDAVQVGYVGTLGRHLDILGSHNSPSQALAPGANLFAAIPFPDFSPNSAYESTNGSSNYNSLQAVYNRELSRGISVGANYTYSRCFSDAAQFGGSFPGYRAQWLSGFGIQGDTQLCDADATHVIHAVGTVELPVGRGRSFLAGTNRIVDTVIGGWSFNYLFSHQSGQPFTINCPIATSAFFGCYANKVPGQNLYGAKNVNHWLNSAAFSNPAVLTGPAANFAFLGGDGQQARGPEYNDLDASLFKQFPVHEAVHVEFRAEAFNLANTAQFAQPNSLDFTNANNFSQITTLRGNPRLLQLALKLYY